MGNCVSNLQPIETFVEAAGKGYWSDLRTRQERYSIDINATNKVNGFIKLVHQ